MELRMRYATTSDGVRIAFAVAGEGPHVVRTPALPFSHCQLDWRQSAFFERLAALVTVVPYDSRGTGLSDRDVDDVSLDARVRDIEAVVDHLQLERFALYGVNFSGTTAIAYTTRHPDRVSHLILDDAFARTSEFMGTAQNRSTGELIDDWANLTENLAWVLHQGDLAETKRYAEFLRACVSRETALKMWATFREEDVTELLPLVAAPTLVLQHEGLRNLPMNMGRELAAGITAAQLVTLRGGATDDHDPLLEAIGDFLGIARAPVAPASPSAFRTVLFTDIVGHTKMMQRLGDAKGREVLREHERITRATLSAHGGTEVKTDGDSFMASFSSVSSAVECAVALQRAFSQYSESNDEAIVVRIGLNAGEPIEEDGDFFGSAVILGARIKDEAGGGEILVPEAVRHMLSGKSFVFGDRGEFALKGFDDAVRLYEVRWHD